MWVKFDVIPSDENIIVLPKDYEGQYRNIDFIRFGCIISPVIIEYDDKSSSSEINSFERPCLTYLSDKLREKLLLPLCLVYQAAVVDNTLSVGPVIGLMLGNQNHRYNPRHMQKYSDRFGIYSKIGGLIYAFSPTSVQYESHKAYGLFYNIFNAKWSYGSFPLPEVIYRRDFHTDENSVKRLIACTDRRLFNSTRFTKMELYNLLKNNDQFRSYLPETVAVTSYEQIKAFVDRNKTAILKPIDLSRGRGICIIEKSEGLYQISDYREKVPLITVLPRGLFEEYISQNRCFMKNYLIQQFLHLAHIESSLFDIRVVMQKQPRGGWRCGGIECRVSGGNMQVTNISRGGYALTLDEALKLSFTNGYIELSDKILQCCERFCSIMDTIGEHFAEFGIDIAVDVDKRIWLIEANVFPSFKGFKAIDKRTYLSIRYAPMLYAASLAGFETHQDDIPAE